MLIKMDPEPEIYDICVIGGGINGTGIARDAAGRGLKTLLLEAGDLAGATSSASTKLIHGGLRYLAQGDIKLVRESLYERERLLEAAPHIIWPLEFIFPYENAKLLPAWAMRLGLLAYDHLAARKYLPASKSLRFDENSDIKDTYSKGFSYYDCWVEDSRLVVLNARDAADQSATIKTYTKATALKPLPGKTGWQIETGNQKQYSAKALVNAAGPWVRALLDNNNLSTAKTHNVRLVRGSHIVTSKFFDGDHAYILEQPDGRVVFAIPYEHNFNPLRHHRRRA